MSVTKATPIVYTFSEEFQSKLRNGNVNVIDITPESFIKSFENYITKTKGFTIGFKTNMWTFIIPEDVKVSDKMPECLSALSQALENSGYQNKHNYKPGTFAIVKVQSNTPGKFAVLTCQLDDCNITYTSTTADDKNACAVVICMQKTNPIL
jgi:hypothetical protein